MKNLLFLIPIIFLFAVTPIIVNSAYGTHVTGFSGVYDDRWYHKEVDNTTGLCTNARYVTGSGWESETSTASISAGCTFFKVFEDDDIDGKEVTVSQSTSRTNGKPTYHYSFIYDGSYDASSTTDFPENGLATKGAGQLYSSGGTVQPTTPFTPDLSSGTETHVTYFVQYIVDSSSTGSVKMRLGGVTIADLGTWNFPYGFPTEGYSSWEVIRNQTGSFDDYSTVMSYNPEIMDPPTGLTATADSDTQITLTWTDPVNGTQKHDTTNIQLFYKNGTDAQSDYWTFLADVSAGVETYVSSSVHQAGHTYSFKANSDDDLVMSFDSNVDTATTTGTETITQTYDTFVETYSDVGIEDNSFYAREISSRGDNVSLVSMAGTCDHNQLTTTSTLGWKLGITDSGTGNCLGHMKSFPLSEIDGYEWTLGSSYHRSTAGVYHYAKIYDGDMTGTNLFNSTMYVPYSNWLFTTDSVDGGDRTLGAGELYSSGGTTNPTSPFTPDLSSATESFVTFFHLLEDDDGSGDDVHSTMTTFNIGDKFIFSFPNTADERTEKPLTNVITGTNHDITRGDTYTPPKKPTGLAGTDEAVLTWTIPSFDGDKAITGYSIWRQCTSDSAYVNIVADTSSTDATYTDSTFDAVGEDCDYKVGAINEIGTGWNSTSITITSGNDGPTFSAIGSTGASATWIAVTTSEDLYGYGLQISTDDTTFITETENTASTTTDWNFNGLSSSTTYYVQWRDVYYNGTYGDWSKSGSFTTLVASGSGGGPVANVKNTIPPEDLTPEFVPPDPKIGLTALDIFDANQIRIAPGDTKRGLLELVWEGDSNLRINEIVVDESTGLSFVFQQPIEFTPSGTGKTTSQIPYTLESTTGLCAETQTTTCVFNDALYEIPTTVYAESNNELIKFETAIGVNVTDAFDLGMQEIFLGILGLVAVAVVIGKTTNGNKRSRIVGKKRRPNTK